MQFLRSQLKADPPGTILCEGGAKLIPVKTRKITRDDARAFRKRVAKRRAKKGYR